MRPPEHPILRALAASVVALAVVGVPFYLFTREDAPELPPLDVRATTDGTHKVPAVPDERSLEIDSSLDAFLRTLYDRAFAQDEEPRAEDEPPAVLDRLRPMFSPDALAALGTDPGVFQADGFRMTTGTVSYGGVVTGADTDEPQALLEISLVAQAVPEESSLAGEIRQVGTLRLSSVDGNWRVEAFDLSLEAETLEPPEEQDAPN
jgi:hypothetical protein